MKIYTGSNPNNFLDFYLNYKTPYTYFSSETDTEVISILLNNNTNTNNLLSMLLDTTIS